MEEVSFCGRFGIDEKYTT